MNQLSIVLLISFLLLLIIRSAQSIPIETSMKYDNEYALEYDMLVEGIKCQNGGYPTLDGDWCACEPNFTGRHCEVEIEPDNINGCGSMLNNEEEILDCAYCKCTKNWLRCTAYRCNVNVVVIEAGSSLTSNNTDKHEGGENSSMMRTVAKGSSLADLVTFMENVESLAYRYYVNDLLANGSYEIIYKDVNSDTTNQEETRLNHQDGAVTDNRTKVIVFKSSPTKLIGLYFVPPLINPVIDNSLNCSFNLRSSFFVLFAVLIINRLFLLNFVVIL